MSYLQRIRQVDPYTPGEQPKGEGIIKLNTNECPYSPSPRVLEALRDMEERELALYPDPEATELKEALSAAYGVPAKQIFVGVGSDEVLGFAFQTFFCSGSPILFPELTYSFYPVWAGLYGIPFKRLPLTEAFRIDPKDYTGENGGVVFPNPNAPTGVLEPLEVIRQILENNPESLVIIDEAYIDFAGDRKACSAIDLLPEYENLLVVQTFSKSRALAGMRIGMAFGHEEAIRAMSAVKYSFNSYTLSRAAIHCGAASAGDEEYLKRTVEKIVRTREEAKKRLSDLGFTFPDAKGNFLFARPPGGNAEEIFTQLKAKGIYVRYFKGALSGEYLRITIGTPEQMEVLYQALEEIREEYAG